MTSSSQTIKSILKVSGTNIVDGDGSHIILKGAGLGGHMNMENFITGFSGHEFEHRKAMRQVLGEQKCNFFFDRFLDYFFTDADAKYFASLGLNCIRVPFNYRHFEDDLNPGVYKQSGFDLLERVVQHCQNNGLYVIFDLHAVPGGQNQDWHSDTGLNRALFWEFKNFQDRVIDLWVEIARRYKGNPFVAGYNPLNEPADPDHVNLLKFYERVEGAIRAVDPEHILFIDGNTYAMDFSHFPPQPLPNSVYACHDYNMMGFPTGDPYLGTDEQKKKLRTSFERKVSYMRQHNIPIWNGEFGPVYASISDAKGSTPAKKEANVKLENSQRFAMLEEQLQIYRETGVSWSIWLYKDIGYQGMTYIAPDSPYMKLIAPFLAKKKRLGLDFWGSSDKSAVAHIYDPFVASLKEMVAEHLQKKKYPSPLWTFDRQVERCVRECLMSEYVGYEMAELFSGKTESELDQLAGSFKLENCVMREELNEILRKDAARGVGN
ncbi:glycoside hydrolase superfamily [Phaeosphaeriaceae sp. PMI808]|nr:glycoside hydrolase superfamily [Phaeosphaeriaceae sp. PMI808]